MTIRSFIAFNLPDPLRRDMRETMELLRESNAQVSWVRVENLHLTLKFLGDVETDRFQSIDEALARICASHEGFPLAFRDLGCFPSLKNPRVVWIGVTGNSALAALQVEVEEAMAVLGFEKEERPFSPHLTIGRVKGPAGRQELVQQIHKHGKKDFGAATVCALSLMKSDLTPGGARYTVLKDFSLKSTQAA